MIRVALAIWLVVLAGAAAAQTVAVRSGAHDGFHRLVLDMPGRMGWRVADREGGAALVFDTRSLGFDLGAVFSRIDRSRLRAVSASDRGGRLDLDFACACRPRVFWHGARMLVVDIIDDEMAGEARESRPHPSRPGSDDRPSVAALSPPTRSFAGRALAEDLRLRVGPRMSALPGTDRAAALPAPDPDAFRGALLNQLGRAASQGLLTPAAQARSVIAGAPADGPQAVSPAARIEPEVPPAVEVDASGVRSHLRAQTSMDRDLTSVASRNGADIASDTCPPTETLDVASWGGTRAFAAEIGRLNGGLFGEFDRMEEDRILQLARLYIHYGFGAEARQVLGWLDDATPERDIAAELADLVEHGSPGEGRLAGAVQCDEPAPLWALLAMPELPDERVFDHRALQRSFVALPEGLRRALGPVLVRRLASAGHDRTAEAIFRLIGRDGQDASAGGRLVKAGLAEKAGERAAAETALKEVVRSNAAQSGEALAESIERRLDSGTPVGVDEAELAGALAFEHRGTPLGDRLTSAFLWSLGASGAFDRAAEEFDRSRSSLSEEMQATVAARLVGKLAGDADDITFLRHVMSDRIALPGSLPAPLAVAVSRRLLDLGFTAHASRHVPPGSIGGRAGDVRLLRAEIALAQGRPAEAELELVGLEGRDADLLRAEILVARGRDADARRLFAIHGETARADRAALRMGTPEAMRQAEASAVREAGEIAGFAPATAGPAESAIEVQRAVLARSEETRAVVERLLSATPPIRER